MSKRRTKVTQTQQPNTNTDEVQQTATEPTVSEQTAPTVPPVPPVVKQEPPAPPVPETVEEYIQLRHKLTNPVSQQCTRVIDLVKDYVEKMQPNVPNTPQDGGIYQAQLFNAFIEAISLNNGEHRIALDGISWLITKHRADVFSDKRVMRYFNNVRLNSKDIILFRRLIVLIVNCANMATRRRELSKINMRQIADLLTPDMQQKLTDYYR